MAQRAVGMLIGLALIWELNSQIYGFHNLTLNSNSKTAYQTSNTVLFRLRKRNITSLCQICARSLTSCDRQFWR